MVVSGPQDLEYLGERLEWLRQKLLDLEEQKNRFLRQMSHELKTPLTAVREGSQLLAEEVVGKLTPQQREIAEILRHNSIELQKQIEALLNYGASQFHKVALDLKPVSLERVVSRVAGDQRLALRSRDLKLDVSGPQVLVTADAEMLRVTLDNLVSNAIKFSPPGGTIAHTHRAQRLARRARRRGRRARRAAGGARAHLRAVFPGQPAGGGRGVAAPASGCRS